MKNKKVPGDGEVTRVTRPAGMQQMVRVMRNIWQSKEMADN